MCGQTHNTCSYCSTNPNVISLQLFYEKDSVSQHLINQSIDRTEPWPDIPQTYDGQSIASDDQPLYLPQYLNYFCILGQLGITALTRISYLVKMIIIISLVIGQCCLNVFELDKSFDMYDSTTYGDSRYFLGHETYLSIIIVTVAITLFIINRQVSLNSRF